MSFLFWLLWIVDCLLAVFIIVGKNFRNSFTNNDPTAWVLVLFIACLVGSLVLRYVLRQQVWSYVLVLSPLILLVVWYLMDKLG
ncbi:MAG TPA: hypothetical protein PKH93_06115 [Chitinophagales bacterium]|nr:hypothetical protein [Chitinophagales bacterium]HNL07132.1 hypothetical protein [Chitinophagales bacterium]